MLMLVDYRGSENSERSAGHLDCQAKISTGPAEIKLDRKKSATIHEANLSKLCK